MFRKALALDATFGPAHFFLGQALTESAAHEQALFHASALSRCPANQRKLSRALSRGGHGGRCRPGAEDPHELRAASKQICLTGRRRPVQAGMGETSGAIESLRAATSLRASDLAWLAVRPTFRSLRSDARFLDLIRRLGLRAPAQQLS